MTIGRTVNGLLRPTGFEIRRVQPMDPAARLLPPAEQRWYGKYWHHVLLPWARDAGFKEAWATAAPRRSGSARLPSTNGVTSGSSEWQLSIDRSEMAQSFKQQMPAARDARHDGADRYRQHLGDFGVRKLFHVT